MHRGEKKGNMTERQEVIGRVFLNHENPGIGFQPWNNGQQNKQKRLSPDLIDSMERRTVRGVVFRQRCIRKGLLRKGCQKDLQWLIISCNSIILIIHAMGVWMAILKHYFQEFFHYTVTHELYWNLMARSKGVWPLRFCFAEMGLWTISVVVFGFCSATRGTGGRQDGCNHLICSFLQLIPSWILRYKPNQPTKKKTRLCKPPPYFPVTRLNVSLKAEKNPKASVLKS